MRDIWDQQPLSNQPPIPNKKRKLVAIIFGVVAGVLLFSCILCGVIGSLLPKTPDTGSVEAAQAVTPVSTPTKVVQVVAPTVKPTDTPTPKPTPSPTPTPTPIPTETPAQIEADYKAITKDTTVVNLDKDGKVDDGKNVHFTCKILSFVKDSSGNTAGINVTAVDSYADGVVQVGFTSDTDITQLNEGDILEVWGSDLGVFSGTNAFGGTVQEVGIQALYMYDQTTNYHTDS